MSVTIDYDVLDFQLWLELLEYLLFNSLHKISFQATKQKSLWQLPPVWQMALDKKKKIKCHF